MASHLGLLGNVHDVVGVDVGVVVGAPVVGD